MTSERLKPSVVIVSPYFPPSTLAGVHRSRHLAKHLPSHGWKPIIIRVDERHYSESNDPGLAALVPSGVTQIRTGAVPTRFARSVGFGDIGLRAYLPLAKAIEESMRLHTPRAVLVTGSPYYPMLLSERISKRWGVPVILDFQDPWVSAEGARQAKWSKAGIAHRISTLLEPRALRSSAWITSVSQTQNDEMAARYSWIDRSRMSAIPIGGDPADFETLRAAPRHRSALELRPGDINLLYIGTFLPRATPVVGTLFKAAALLKEWQPRIAERVKLIFIGTSNQPNPLPNDPGAHRVAPIAAAAGVSEMVQEHPARVPYMDALALMANADGLLLLGSDERHYTASKIYPALMSGRPFLSIFHSESSSHEILSRAGGGAIHSFASLPELAEMAGTIALGLQRFGEGSIQFPPPNAAAYEPYTAHAVSGQFADIFDRVLKPASTPATS
jgi:hypothetical protein